MIQTIRDTGKWAAITECGTYRYELGRKVSDEPGSALFVMLNPSTADSFQDDPTIRRCMRYCLDWGYGTLNVVNLFAFRTSKPERLKAEFYKQNTLESIVGPLNHRFIQENVRHSDIVVCAWGVHGSFQGRSSVVLDMIREWGGIPLQLKSTMNGEPSHPLYLKKDLKPIPMRGG